MVAQGHVVGVRLVAEVAPGRKIHQRDEESFNIFLKDRNQLQENM